MNVEAIFYPLARKLMKNGEKTPSKPKHTQNIQGPIDTTSLEEDLMPQIAAFALSESEQAMYILFKTGDIMGFDVSKSLLHS